MIETLATTGIALIGDDVTPVGSAFRGLDGVTVVSGKEPELLDLLSKGEVRAVVIVPPASDLTGSMRQALAANRHVLVAGPAALSVKSLCSLDDLARRRGCALLIDEGFLRDERFEFVCRMTGAPQALWRPRYVRAVRTGAEQHPIHDLAFAEIARILAVIGAPPRDVSAVAPRIDDETGHADAMIVTMTFHGGPVATVHVSMVEPNQQHEVTVACDGRTIVLDAFDVRAPLRIHAPGRHSVPSSPGAWMETITERPAAGSPGDRLSSVAAAFVSAVRARDVEVNNGRELLAAAAVWSAARESIASGGVLIPVERRLERPELHVIEGGGKRAGADAPALFVVRGR